MSETTYARAADVGVVAAYFAPRPSAARAARFERFVAPLRRGGVTLRVAELVLDGRAAELPDAPDVVRLRARDALWHKERLLEHAIAALPGEITKVCWLDADVLFADPSWLVATSRALDACAFVQPFSRVTRESPRGDAPASPSYAAVLAHDPSARRRGDFARHGHTGYAWAARRELLAAHGLYTRAIAGGADHAMAHAFSGDLEGSCLDRVLGLGAQRSDFTAWARGLFRAGAVGVVGGDIRHLFHGEPAERRYVERYEKLRELDFDPRRDLVDEGSVWAFSAASDPRLRAWLGAYFAGRESD